MKQFPLLSVCISVIFLVLLFTGFQCGSSEMTSAKLYISQKNYEKADTALMREIEKNPQNTEALYLLGRLKLDQDNIPKAIEVLDKAAATTNAKEFEKDITLARTYAWQVSLNKGASLYNRSVTLAREAPEAKKDSIRLYREAAITAYRDAITASPDSTMNYQNLAIDQFALGDYDAEIATLKEGIDRTKSHSLDALLIDAYSAKYNWINQKIQTAEAAGNKQEASELYTQALTTIGQARSLYPDNSDLAAMEIDLYVRSGKAEQAKPSIRIALQKDPANKVYNYNLGVLLLQTDSLKEAVPYFEKALDADKDYEPALQNIAVTHMKLGDRMKKAAQDPGSKKEINKSYIEHFKKAAGYFQRLTELKPDEANYWDYLASAYANADMVKDAKKALEKSDAIRKKK
ncbi:MAG: tetratricopeptide repeat protein [Ignavibacteriae bacterium]|nr:tetratricopeptide repeat protein [Ignavibacteria bacterium]MBI3364326.1 tetratricopeptide repeat protein [Ignavibacteriota bacterium]